MSTHHNTKHDERSKSNYQTRPGMMGTSGHLAAIEGGSGLRARQERRIRNTCTLPHEHDTDSCNGSPFPTSREENDDE